MSTLERYRSPLIHSQRNTQPPPIVDVSPCAAPEMRINVSEGYLALPGECANWLCWLHRGLRQFPKVGRTTGNVLYTNQITLPFGGSFQVGPDGPPDLSMGRIMPYEWETEMVGMGIYRLKVDWHVSILAGALTPDQVIKSAEATEFRILQLTTEDRSIVALNVGDAQDAARSTLAPADGGFWLPAGAEWIPYKPTTQAFDFAGLMPGTVGVDSYQLRASIRVYTRQIQCM